MCRTSVLPVVVPSPFDQVDAALLQLAAGPQPLTLPAAVTCPGQSGAWPVDRIRAWMAHPSTHAAARARVWGEICDRRLVHGAPWDTVALAMVIPGLRRTLARLPKPHEIEQEELEQEVLAAVVEELAVCTPDEDQVGLRLVRAGDRAAHRLVYEVLQGRQLRRVPLDEAAMAQPLPAAGDAAVFAVLERAAQAGVLTRWEVELIAATRLDGQDARSCALAAGRCVRSVFRRRAAAEERLAKALRTGEL